MKINFRNTMSASSLIPQVLKVVKYPAEVLRHKCAPVPREDIASAPIQQLVADMLATVRAEDGLGLAAPQVGATSRIFVMRTPLLRRLGRKTVRASSRAPAFHALINPEVRRAGPSTSVWLEGCMSLPDYGALVRRRTRLEVTYLTPSGTPVREEVSGLAAAIFAHELDHLDGLLLMDRELPGAAGEDELSGAWQAANARMARALAKEFGEDPYGGQGR